MKKLLICVLALVMLVGACSFGVLAANRYGDIYKDNSINEKDAVKLAQYLAGCTSLTSAELKAADVYADGKVDTKDAVKLAQYLAKWDGIVLGSMSNSVTTETPEETDPPIIVTPPVETEDDGWGDIVRP